MNQIQFYILISNVISLKLKKKNIRNIHAKETKQEKKKKKEKKKRERNHLTNKIHMNQIMEATTSILLFC